MHSIVVASADVTEERTGSAQADWLASQAPDEQGSYGGERRL
jgi:hypothetical protein